MLPFLSAITAVKDYVEIVHKLVETNSTTFSSNGSTLISYSDFGSIVTYTILFIKDFLNNLLNFSWLNNLSSLPIIVPNIASSMISEISVLNNTFHNAFTFFETPISYGNNNIIFYCLEKFTIGILNSFFLFLPTSISHLICLRRFVMQGLEAGYIAGLGTIAGNIIWIGSIVFGLRFLVIPWLSLDIFRYLLGFMLLVKYMWDSTTKFEKKSNQVLEDLSKWKIFFLNFLLAFTEQTNIYPFISNLSIGSDSTFLESFPTETFPEFFGIHFFYLFGIFLGSYSLLQLTCWFWENPAYNFYMWAISSGSVKITTSLYYKILNFIFLYLTMICAISSVSYFGIDYTLTNPIGFVHEDRLTDQKGVLETSFINTKASDRNTRRNRGRHGRRERWKRRIRRYRTFDASLYDQGTYDLFPIEDLNYGFDKFWLRRKIRNHRVHFRFFPGPWMRSFKKQLSRPRLESFMGPRVEFFRILFEQVYHPEFHDASNLNKKTKSTNSNFQTTPFPYQIGAKARLFSKNVVNRETSIYIKNQPKIQKQSLIKEHSALRKFVRKMSNRIQSSTINFQFNNFSTFKKMDSIQPIYSKHWKHIFSKLSHQTNGESTILRQQENMFRRFYSKILLNKNSESSLAFSQGKATKKYDSLANLSKKDRQILRYKTFLLNEQINSPTQMTNNNKFSKIETLATPIKIVPIKNEFQKRNESSVNKNISQQNNQTLFLETYKPLTLLHPLKFYLQREQAFQKKFQFYGANVYRTFGIENNAPYFRTMMKRFFYYYKPTLRWERTMRTATMRKARRKGPHIVRKLNVDKKTQILSKLSQNSQDAFLSENNNIETNFQKPTHFYSLINKRATRYRYQIYKDVLQHWYYTPINRLLLKFDVDSFIRRQPSSYFLSKKEEQIIHLHRLMLAEHYDTLRFYTAMEHYNSMKNRIGGTKSLASRVYLQQFQGTFKKVRHLFALTPSNSENTILKFDQPLYNEYSNTYNSPILNKSLFHEELLIDEDFLTPLSTPIYLGLGQRPHQQTTNNFFELETNDLANQSTQIIGEYIKKATPIREEYRNKLFSEKNYWELTKFLYKGQKFRGLSSITNQHDFLNQKNQGMDQEKSFFYNVFLPKEKNKRSPYQIGNSEKNQNTFKDNSNSIETLKNNNLWLQKLWIELFKKCQNTLYDQEALKQYLTKHVDKRRKKQQRQEKYLTLRFDRLENWFLNKNTLNQFTQQTEPLSQKRLNQTSKNSIKSMSPYSKGGLTTAIRKGIKESILFQKNLTNKTTKLNVRNNKPKIFLPQLSKTISDKNVQSEQINTTEKDINFKNHLMYRIQVKDQIVQKYQVEQNLKKLLESAYLFKGNTSSEKGEKTSNFNSNFVSRQSNIKQKIFNLYYLIKKTLTFPYLKGKKSLKWVSKYTIQPFIFTFGKTTTLSAKASAEQPLTFLGRDRGLSSSPIRFESGEGREDQVDNINGWKASWRKNEIALTKRKKTRRILKRLKNTKERNRDLQTSLSTSYFDFSKKNNLIFDPFLNSPFLNSPYKNRGKEGKEGKNQNKENIFSKRQKQDMFEEKSQQLSFGNPAKAGGPFKQKKVRYWKRWYDNVSNFDKKTLLNINKIGLFKKKRTRLRRNRLLKHRRPIKKRTLGEKFKRKLKLLKRYSRSTEQEKITTTLNRFDKKVDVFQMITKRKYIPQSQFQIRDIKQRRTRFIKRRFWRKHKKQKYAQDKRKQRKRRRYALGKIRTINKDSKRIKGNWKVKQWWWEKLLPNIKANFDAKWQAEMDQQIIQDFSKELKENPLQIGNRDYKPLAMPEAIDIGKNLIQTSNQNISNPYRGKDKKGEVTKVEKFDKVETAKAKTTPIQMDKSFLTPEPLNFEKVPFGIKTPIKKVPIKKVPIKKAPIKIGAFALFTPIFIGATGVKRVKRVKTEASKIKSNFNIIDQITNNLYSNSISYNQTVSSSVKNTDFSNHQFQGNQGMGQELEKTTTQSFVPTNILTEKAKIKSQAIPKIVNVNPIPFYAGWDETLRKFVITNRLLSSKTMTSFKSNSEISNVAPLYGMNAATTLYWQVPFTTYDPDQFFALGMDGFSPIGWRKFHFRFNGSSIFTEGNEKQTTKPILVQSQTLATTNKSIEKAFSENELLSTWKKTNPLWLESKKNLNTQINLFDRQKFKFNRLKDIKNQLRRSQKRYKRVKKHPRPPVWFPSGPLTNQVLPVHYIYIFYNRYRLPRDRYIRRRLRQTKKENVLRPLSTLFTPIQKMLGAKGLGQRLDQNQQNFTTWKDFTLRKRVKPRRKYHRTRHLYKTENLFIRRESFRNIFDTNTYKNIPLIRERFSPPNFMGTGIDQRSSLDNQKFQQRRKVRSKQQTENLRIRQLRRRVQRQVLRPVWRYRPRAGGFTWPGDYLRLELVKAPILTGLADSTVSEKDKKINQLPGYQNSLSKDVSEKETDSSRKRKTRKKKRRTIQEWQIQPKKYLLRKHNVQVLKKRLEKAHNSHKFYQRLKELDLLLK